MISGRKHIMYTELSGKELLKIVIIKFFTNDVVNTIVNILIPCIISIHCTNFVNNKSWWSFTIGACILIVIFNIASTIIKTINNKELQQLTMAYHCYGEQCTINSKFATNIYRLNKSVNEYITKHNPIDKKSLDKIADFQTFAFLICESIHSMICKMFGQNLLCEVTLMKKEDDFVKMVAYANDNNAMPSSYKTTFSLDESDIFFINLFNDLNGMIKCIPNQKGISDKFQKFKGSVQRENAVCQYIGIPIKTNRNEIELLLQIDVSKPKVFGKNETQMESFAKNIFYPYAMLLHKSYERDLVFNQYYDMIVMMLSKSER